MNFKFAGINSRGNKCYNNGNTFIEEVNGDFWYLNQSPAYGFDGIEGEPWYKVKKDVINIIE